jgi:putative acyl-CoA dehydrogenase
MANKYPLADRLHADTHAVENQPPALNDSNSYLTDLALMEAVQREGGAWAREMLERGGEYYGSAEAIELGEQANRNKPELISHDHYGNRIDEVAYHPAYHCLMAHAIENELHSLPWIRPEEGAHVVRAAQVYMLYQAEAGHCCPLTMSFAGIPTLQLEAKVAEEWVPKITNGVYDPGNSHYATKGGYTIGMGMTEIQGGSDVRSNTTQAHAIGQHGSGEAYELVGHKFFVSAPMSDAFLMLAQADAGISCFLVPRWRPDGSRNPLQLIRLKDKMGNVSNASAETELRGAFGWLLGDEGRGIANILDMVSLTRFDCAVASSGAMRQAAVQAIHHCRHRVAFGNKLVRQPLMKNVLADLALEGEAALAFGMRLARALDAAKDETAERSISRLGTAVGKFWICRRTPNHAFEAMECLGGSGVMETTAMPRLYREAPVNSIWEGSGNIQCLDVLRVIQEQPDSLQCYLGEVMLAKGTDSKFDTYVTRLIKDLENKDEQEYRARRIVEGLALAMQASLLIRAGNDKVSDAFCSTRLGSGSGHIYGLIPPGLDCDALIERAFPG